MTSNRELVFNILFYVKLRCVALPQRAKLRYFAKLVLQVVYLCQEVYVFGCVYLSVFTITPKIIQRSL